MLEEIKEGFEAQLEVTRLLVARTQVLELEVTKLWEDLRELRALLVLTQGAPKVATTPEPPG